MGDHGANNRLPPYYDNSLFYAINWINIKLFKGVKDW